MRACQVDRFGQTEVQHLDRAVRLHFDIGRFEIPVNEAALVRGLERVDDLRRVRERFAHAQTDHRTLGERRPLHQLHHDGLDAVGVLDAVDGGDVGMVDRGERHGLALKARPPLGIESMLVGQDLDRDVAFQTGVARAVDLAHASAVERFDDLVGAKASTGRDHSTGVNYSAWARSLP